MPLCNSLLPYSLVAQLVKNLLAMQETLVQFLGREDPLEKEKATCSSILAWRIPWTVAHQAPLSTGIFRQEYWSGLPFPSPGEADSPELKMDSLPTESPGEPMSYYIHI